MKKIDNSRIEYAALTIVPSLKELYTDNIENRSEANIDDGKYIRSHWQKNIIKHQPPIINNVEDLKLLDKGKNS
jgi:hypothetical protein